MKNILQFSSTFFVFILFYTQIAFSQIRDNGSMNTQTNLNSSENPTIDPANEWVVDYFDEVVAFKEIRIYTFSESDTLLNGKWYKEMIYRNTTEPQVFHSANEFYRQEGDKVWKYNGQYDILLVDFALHTGDTLFMDNPDFTSYPLVIASRDTVMLEDGKPRIQLKYYCGNESGMEIPDEDSWISITEGLGTETSIFFQLITCSLWDPFTHRAIRCYYENGNLVYKADQIDDCLISSSKQLVQSVFKVYPNPTSNDLFIESEYEGGEISILNLNGDVVFQKTISKVDYLDVSSLSVGIYFIQYQHPNGRGERIKFIKI